MDHLRLRFIWTFCEMMRIDDSEFEVKYLLIILMEMNIQQWLK